MILKRAHTLRVGLILAMLAGGAGCVGGGRAGGGGAPANGPLKNNNVTLNEVVTLRLVPFDELRQANGDYVYGTTVHLPPRPAGFGLTYRPDRVEGGSRFLEGLIVPAVTALIGMGVDTVQNWLKEEAAKHERQYRQTVYATDFWEGLDKPRYAGIEIVRSAGGWTSDADPASRIFIAFVYNPEDPRMVLLKPVYMEINAARALVSTIGRDTRMDVKINAVIEGAYIGADGNLVKQDAIDPTFVVDSFDLDTADNRVLVASWEDPNPADNDPGRVWTGDSRLTGAAAGFFRAPRIASEREQQVAEAIDDAKSAIDEAWEDRPNSTAQDRTIREAAWRSFEADGLRGVRSEWLARINHLASGGALGLSVVVTETDRSRVQDVLVQFADFVGSQKSALQEQARLLLEEDEQP